MSQRGEPFWSLLQFFRGRPHLDNVLAEAIPVLAYQLNTLNRWDGEEIGGPPSVSAILLPPTAPPAFTSGRTGSFQMCCGRAI